MDLLSTPLVRGFLAASSLAFDSGCT
ncbi:unnamed protein product, partial [Diplocarpon coronariae]